MLKINLRYQVNSFVAFEINICFMFLRLQVETIFA